MTYTQDVETSVTLPTVFLRSPFTQIIKFQLINNVRGLIAVKSQKRLNRALHTELFTEYQVDVHFRDSSINRLFINGKMPL